MRLVKLLDYPIPHWWKDKTHALKVEVWENEDDDGRWYEAGRVFLVADSRRHPLQSIRRQVYLDDATWQDIRDKAQECMWVPRTVASYVWGGR